MAFSSEQLDRLRSAIERASAERRTLKDVANEAGVSYASATVYARRWGFDFTSGPRRPLGLTAKNLERVQLMAALYRDGYTLEQIGAQYSITRERVRQLLKRQYGITAVDGGDVVRTRKLREARKQRRDAAYMAKHGCTYEQYKTIRGTRGPTRAFLMQRKNAHFRGIEWKLKAWEWWTIWQESGHWHERGRGQGYVMCRINDEGPYAVWNVFIAPAIENNSKTKLKKSGLPIGVRHIKRGNYECFVAMRMLNGKSKYLGSFKTPELAHAAYLAATPTNRSAA